MHQHADLILYFLIAYILISYFCNPIHSNPVLYNPVLCDPILYDPVLCNSILCNPVLCGSVLCRNEYTSWYGLLQSVINYRGLRRALTHLLLPSDTMAARLSMSWRLEAHV
jgi:hypothetical protein